MAVKSKNKQLQPPKIKVFWLLLADHLLLHYNHTSSCLSIVPTACIDTSFTVMNVEMLTVIRDEPLELLFENKKKKGRGRSMDMSKHEWEEA